MSLEKYAIFLTAAGVNAERRGGGDICAVAEWVDAACNGNNAEGRKDAFPVSDDLSHAWFKSTPAQHIKGENMIREDNLDKFTDEELIQMVKESMDELGIAYEEGPGGWGNFLPLDPEKDMQPPGA